MLEFRTMESGSLSKACGLLEATAGYPHGRTLAELADEVGMPKPTAHRILNSLMALGYLERPNTGVYRQSMLAKRLVSDAASRRLIGAAEPHLRELHRRSKETINLGMLRQDRVLYLEVLECTLPLRRVKTRSSDGFHTTALGRAIAAFLPHDKQVRLLAKAKLERRTPLTITDRKQLLAILERVAKDGYAIETDETDIGVTCIAAPIFFPKSPVPNGEALNFDPVALAAGSISVSVPTARATGDDLDRLLKLVQRAALASSAGMAKALKSVDR